MLAIRPPSSGTGLALHAKLEGRLMETRLHDLTVEVIQRCPNSCLFCSSLASISSRHQLSFDEIMHVSDQAASLGLESIGISGGEPLLHPDIKQIIPSLNEKLMVRLYTTGIHFDARGKAVHFSDWVEFDPSKTTIIFNVQSTDSMVHDFLTRRNGSFILTRNALLSAKERGFRVEVHLVPNRLNLSTIESSLADFKEWKVDEVSFLRLVPQGYASENARVLLLRENDQEELSRKFVFLSGCDWGNTRLRFGVPFAGLVGQPKRCNAGETKLIIRYDGKVLPCEAFKDSHSQQFLLGDIREDTLESMLRYGVSLRELKELKLHLPIGETCPAQMLYHEKV